MSFVDLDRDYAPKLEMAGLHMGHDLEIEPGWQDG